MATFKAVVRNPRKDGLYQVYIRVLHNTKPGYINTNKFITRKGIGKNDEIEDAFVLKYCGNLIVDFVDRLNKVDYTRWSVKQVKDYLLNGDSDICFSDYARRHIDRLIDNGQVRNAKNYKLALQHLERYAGTTQIMFGDLNSAMINKWLLTLEGTRRAKEMYPICLRQVFRAAINEYNDYDNNVIKIKSNPWPKVRIPSADRAEKIAISAEDCRRFFSAPLPSSKLVDPLAELGRDVAKMVLCLAGINTIDLYGLQKTDYHDGVICYKRAKTRKARTDDAYIEMRVEPFIAPLFEKYRADDNDPYLLNFHNRFSSADSFNANVNTGIKQICKCMELDKEDYYCVYTFRHTWGTVAQNDCEATIAEVAFAMNHSSGHTITRGYIKINFAPAWELNAKVIDFIFFSTKKSKLGNSTTSTDGQHGESLFRLSPKMMIYARAYFRGEVLAEVSDIGFSNIDEVISHLAAKLPATLPDRCAVQFRIKNLDTDREMVYERTKGKGF